MRHAQIFPPRIFPARFFAVQNRRGTGQGRWSGDAASSVIEQRHEKPPHHHTTTPPHHHTTTPPHHHTTTLLCAASLFAAASLSFAGTPISSKKQVKPVEDEDIVVHPVTSPYFAEDSFVTSDIRPVFVYHNVPGNFLGGSSASVTAVQVRLKLTDSLQLVAYKDGWLDVSTRGSGVPFSGADVVNINNNGQETISAAVGVEVRPARWFALRAAFEFPLTGNVDLYGNRMTFSSVIRF